MKKSQWLSLISFVLCAVLMTCLISEIFREKSSSFDVYYEEPQNTVDVLFVGSSHVYSGYCPAVLWREYGVSAYNVYAWSMPVWTAYYYMCEALKTQTPEVVFLDVSSFCLGVGIPGAEKKSVVNREQNTTFKAGLPRFLLTLESLTPDSSTFDLELYHNKWKYPERLEVIHENDLSLAFLRNFGGLFTQLDYEIFDYSFYTDIMPPGELEQKYIEKITELSEEKGFKLVYVCTPYTSNKEQTMVLNWTHQYAAEHGIDYIDFLGEAGQAVGFDYHLDMADGDHINVGGAFKITRYCGEYLKSIGIADRWDNPNAQAITTAADATYRMIEYTDLFGGDSTAEKFAEWLGENSAYSAVLLFPDNVSAAQSVFAAEMTYMDEPAGRVLFVKDGAVVSEDQLVSEMEIVFPAQQCTVVRENGEISVQLSEASELFCIQNDNLCIVLYDEALAQIVRIVEISADGTMVTKELSRYLRGSG